MRLRGIMMGLPLSWIVVKLALAQSPQVAGVQYPVDVTLSDPVAKLQARLERGDLRLEFESKHGYLSSVLAKLDIPVSSQSLVFSKTSLQTDLISPSTPRALYFNDDVYVGWVQDAPMLEIASVDPQYGTIFYVLDQTEKKSPAFKRLTAPCISCHGPARDEVPSPVLLMMSVATDAIGEPISDFELVTDRMPTEKRWGGWYVTARGSVSHLGNKVVVEGSPRQLGEPSSAKPSMNASRYLTPHSDIAALMLLSHQADVHNRMSEAAHQTRTLAAAASPDRLSEAVEPLVRALLFSGAASLPGPVRGTSEFASEFSTKGQKDRRGRSLKELDLERRLLRYPLSYLIYSSSFDGMPSVAREYVYRRLREVLSGRDRSEHFQHLSDADRSALNEILSETKPEFAKFR